MHVVLRVQVAVSFLSCYNFSFLQSWFHSISRIFQQTKQECGSAAFERTSVQLKVM